MAPAKTTNRRTSMITRASGNRVMKQAVAIRRGRGRPRPNAATAQPIPGPSGTGTPSGSARTRRAAGQMQQVGAVQPVPGLSGTAAPGPRTRRASSMQLAGVNVATPQPQPGPSRSNGGQRNLESVRLVPNLRHAFPFVRKDTNKTITHVVHCMIWAEDTRNVMDNCPAKAAIYMQLRYDGTLGFPGGIVDSYPVGVGLEDCQNAVTGALNKELREEMNLGLKKYSMTFRDNYLFTMTTSGSGGNKLMCHFYSKKITYNEYIECEKRALKAEEYGHEVLGFTRVPLYTMEGHHGMDYFGFPAFLNNRFAGCAKEQLLTALDRLGILEPNVIQTAVAAAAAENLQQ